MQISTPLLKEKVAVVTGAGRGIGYAIAHRLAGAGAKVIIGELEEERGQQAAEKLQAQGFLVRFLPLDVTKPVSCQFLVDQTLAAYNRIDILVNNAGVFVLDRSEVLSEESWRLQVDVLLNGVFFMTQASARAAMIPQKSGVILNIASIGGLGGWPMRSAYNASKAAVINLTETLACEWAQHNIRVNCISPGVTRTELNDEAIRKGAANIEIYNRRTPMGRIAEVDEIANVALFLVSDQASFITGENLRVDGGWVPWGNLNARGFPEKNDA